MNRTLSLLYDLRRVYTGEITDRQMQDEITYAAYCQADIDPRPVVRAALVAWDVVIIQLGIDVIEDELVF